MTMSVEESDLSSLLSSATLVFFGSVLGSVSKLVERIFIARVLTTDAYGEVSLGIAVMSISVTVGLVGLDQGIARYVSRFEDDRDVRGVWITGLVIAITLALLLTAALVVFLDETHQLLFDQARSRGLLLVFVAAIPFVVGLKVTVGAIRGLENTIYRTYSYDIIYRGMRILLVVGLLYAGYGIVAAGYAYLAAAIGALIAAHYLLNRLFPLFGPFRTHTREMLTFSAPLVLSTLLTLLLTKADTVMLGFFRSSHQVALYSAAYPLANGLPVILASFGFLYLPLASRLDVDDKTQEINEIYKVTTKWIFIVTFPLFVTFVAFPSDMLTLVFGEEYAQASLALIILSSGFFVQAAYGRSLDTLSALGYTNYILLANVFAFTLNIVLNLLLIPMYGFLGAAIASAASYTLLNVVQYVVLRGLFGISPFSKWVQRTFLVLPLTVLPAAIAASTVVSLTYVTLPLVPAVIGIVSVGLVSVTGCLQPEDKLPLELIEDALGITLPFIWRFVPSER
ncbi:flippase [Halostella pelagica]|uniref:flippase n=1 Tax=Halostella pelagica TaxID=2583824 RepID=UPI0010801353|nr:flippase [Halostella pelagica]